MYKKLKLYQQKSAFMENNFDISKLKQRQRGGYDWDKSDDREKIKTFLESNHGTNITDHARYIKLHVDAAQHWFDANIKKPNTTGTNINQRIQIAMSSIESILGKLEEIKSTLSSTDAKNKTQQTIVLSNCHDLLIALNEFVKERHINDPNVLVKLDQLNVMIKDIINIIPKINENN